MIKFEEENYMILTEDGWKPAKFIEFQEGALIKFFRWICEKIIGSYKG